MDRRASHRERRVWDAASEHLTAAGPGNAGLSASRPTAAVSCRGTCPRPSRPRRAGTRCHGFSPGERRSDHPSGRDLYSCPLSTTIAHFALKISSDGALAVRCTMAPDIAPGGGISLDLLKNSRQTPELAHENARVRAPLVRPKPIEWVSIDSPVCLPQKRRAPLR